MGGASFNVIGRSPHGLPGSFKCYGLVITATLQANFFVNISLIELVLQPLIGAVRLKR
jgi:hypothetical protein